MSRWRWPSISAFASGSWTRTSKLRGTIQLSKVLIIGDLHFPAVHPGYFAFCRDLRNRLKCDRVVLIGDVIDHHNISFHRREVDAPDVNQEFEAALKFVQKWRREFPIVDVTIGNHDERIVRLAASVGILGRMLKSYSELWNTPDWNWTTDLKIDNVHYFHGTGHAGERPAFNAARASMMSTVIGHTHSNAGFQFLAGPNSHIFGLDTGCGVDTKNVAMRYGRHLSRKPLLAAAAVIDGEPMSFRMPCGPGEKYHRRRFK